MINIKTVDLKGFKLMMLTLTTEKHRGKVLKVFTTLESGTTAKPEYESWMVR